MTKYSEIETKTAKNMLRFGYKWIVRNETGRLFGHFEKPEKFNNVWGSVGFSTCVCNYVPIFQSVRFGDKEPTSLESIVHPQILDDAEKKYLSAVIRPFRDKVLYIIKSGGFAPSEECISFHFAGCEVTCLPCFKKGTMYKGMEADRVYTLEELGL